MDSIRKGPHNSLSDVKAMARGKMGGFSIEPAALDRATADFGWGTADIIDAICKLKWKHFWKSEPHKYLPGEIVDVYHAHGLKGMRVYMHLHVVIAECEQMLIIGSCKELEV